MNANIIEAEREAARRKAAAIEQERAYERRLKEYAESLAAFVRDMDTAFDGVEGYFRRVNVHRRYLRAEGSVL